MTATKTVAGLIGFALFLCIAAVALVDTKAEHHKEIYRIVKERP